VVQAEGVEATTVEHSRLAPTTKEEFEREKARILGS
jgi:hypothetical protein